MVQKNGSKGIYDDVIVQYIQHLIHAAMFLVFQYLETNKIHTFPSRRTCTVKTQWLRLDRLLRLFEAIVLLDDVFCRRFSAEARLLAGKICKPSILTGLFFTGRHLSSFRVFRSYNAQVTCRQQCNNNISTHVSIQSSQFYNLLN